jgi:hypothetical protein
MARRVRHAIDPKNLNRVMPAEGIGNMAAPGASETVVVVTGGDAIDPAHVRDLPAGVRVIAVDSGVDQAHALGLDVELAIGDFDSVTPDGLARAESDGAAIDRHPTAKDATDLELALDAAIARRPARIHVLAWAAPASPWCAAARCSRDPWATS